MSRPREFLKRVVFTLRPIQWAFVNYYAHRHGKEQSAIMRDLVAAYVRVDPSFNLDEFEVVTRDLIKQEEDPDLKRVLKEELDEFISQRKSAEAPTKAKK